MERAKKNLLKHGELVPAVVYFWRDGRIHSTALSDGTRELAIQSIRDVVQGKPQPIAVITIHEACGSLPIPVENEIETEKKGRELIFIQGAAKGLETQVMLQYFTKNAEGTVEFHDSPREDEVKFSSSVWLDGLWQAVKRSSLQENKGKRLC
jgi:hypothetical protein